MRKYFLFFVSALLVGTLVSQPTQAWSGDLVHETNISAIWPTLADDWNTAYPSTPLSSLTYKFGYLDTNDGRYYMTASDLVLEFGTTAGESFYKYVGNGVDNVYSISYDPYEDPIVIQTTEYAGDVEYTAIGSYFDVAQARSSTTSPYEGTVFWTPIPSDDVVYPVLYRDVSDVVDGDCIQIFDNQTIKVWVGDDLYTYKLLTNKYHLSQVADISGGGIPEDVECVSHETIEALDSPYDFMMPVFGFMAIVSGLAIVYFSYRLIIRPFFRSV